ncbi:hypothetical protein G3T14_05720 [Methylobacterium sp. BTF04]|uniref:hypothetical protein n=1 Tax=Methylobacterium sp. BTF04 TaxID=2708300 RepID=UPI0013D78A6F|nr:hypothetical protein [Methylobacterium sp. BTF04]NEU11626.1 hypothetical protein [Methylobacterium sp. BTF04]
MFELRGHPVTLSTGVSAIRASPRDVMGIGLLFQQSLAVAATVWIGSLLYGRVRTLRLLRQGNSRADTFDLRTSSWPPQKSATVAAFATTP